VSLLIRPLSSLQRDVFLLNSHPDHFIEALASYDAGHRLLRTYAASLQSSLTRVISIALPYSGGLPVSDSGTCDLLTPSCAFLGSVDLVHFPLGNLGVPSPDYSGNNADIQNRAALTLLRPTKSDNANKSVYEY